MPIPDHPDRPIRCSELSADEPLAGTAAHESIWVLLEYPAGWGRDVLDGEALGPELAPRLKKHLADCGCRILFIRRPGREGQRIRDHRYYICDTRPGSRRVLVGTVGDPAELVELDLSGTTEPAGTRRLHGQLALVCTHGRRDRCCAVRGRPVAARLQAEMDEALRDGDPDAGVWECSHTGGHRFAPVLLLPDTGYTYGSAGVEDYLDVLSAARSGRVRTAGLRGRSTWPPAGQVAEVAVRDSGVHAGVDELRVQPDPDDPLAAEVEHDDGRRWRVEVDRHALAPRPNSCGKDPAEALAWTVRSLREL